MFLTKCIEDMKVSAEKTQIHKPALLFMEIPNRSVNWEVTGVLTSLHALKGSKL